MENPAIVALITVAVLVLIWLVIVLALSGGNLQRVLLVKRVGLRMLRDDEFAAKVGNLLSPPRPEPEKPKRPDGAPFRLLTLLQREGRLLDFLLEEIETATDEQIASGVREIHRSCRKALQEHVELEPILKASEGETVEIPSGFDPSSIQLTGNVTGQPPFRGVLRHHGWRVRQTKLVKPAEGIDELVIQPAEVELM